MSLLNYLDNIPGKIFPKLKPRMVDGFLFFPCKLCREIFHIIGSIILITSSYFLYIHISKDAPILFFIILGIWVTFQEFYLHPKKYNQKLLESTLDWSSWIVPFIFYLILLYLV